MIAPRAGPAVVRFECLVDLCEAGTNDKRRIAAGRSEQLQGLANFTRIRSGRGNAEALLACIMQNDNVLNFREDFEGERARVEMQIGVHQDKSRAVVIHTMCRQWRHNSRST